MGAWKHFTYIFIYTHICTSINLYICISMYSYIHMFIYGARIWGHGSASYVFSNQTQLICGDLITPRGSSLPSVTLA